MVSLYWKLEKQCGNVSPSLFSPHSVLSLNLLLCSSLAAVGCHAGLGVVGEQKSSPVEAGWIVLKGGSPAGCLWSNFFDQGGVRSSSI